MNQNDIDDVMDVPDTPDRLAKPERSAVQMKNRSSSISRHLAPRLSSENGHESRHVVMSSQSRTLSIPTSKSTSSSGYLSNHITSLSSSKTTSSSYSKKNSLPVFVDSETKNLSSRPPKSTSSSIDYKYFNDPADFSVTGTVSSKSTLLFPKNRSFSRTDESILIENVHIEKPSLNSGPPYANSSIADLTEKSQHKPSSIVDLTGSGPHKPGLGHPITRGILRSGRFECSKRSGFMNETSSHELTDCSTSESDVSKKLVDTFGNTANNAHCHSANFENIINQSDDNTSFYPDIVTSPRINKQKRLVRNGCISPINIAKAKQLSERGNNGVTLDINCSLPSDNSPLSSDVIREIVSEENNFLSKKGKEAIIYPCESKESAFKSNHSLSRNSLRFNGKAVETTYIRGSGKHTEETGEWRSIHNRSKEIISPLFHAEQFVKRENEGPRCGSLHKQHRMIREEEGCSDMTDYASNQPLRQAVSHNNSRLGQFNGHSSIIKKQNRRQRRGSILSGECSMQVCEDSEVVVISSSAESSDSQSNSGYICSNFEPIIETDEVQPGSKSISHNEDARARQVESDEVLARSLQEQFYSDMPMLNSEEIDAQIALTLQNQLNSNHVSSSRGSLTSSAQRQYHARPSYLSRRGSQARSPLGRLTRARGRFPGQSRTLLPSSRETTLFPPNMDIDTRIQILVALEARGESERGDRTFHSLRDFNENDYETLLALDETTDLHGGASVHQINGLPTSTVLTDNFDEPCAVCLDTPSVGDTVRHLPCLHKFHKDCIDPWLRRKKSCPICKSSIT